MDKTKRTEIIPTDKEGISTMKFQPLADAIDIFCEALAEDKEEGSYYYSWQANIAMAFYDEFDRTYPKDSDLDIHGIANRAAKNFLDQLINHNKATVERETVVHTIESLDLKPAYEIHLKKFGKDDYPMTEKEAFKLGGAPNVEIGEDGFMKIKDDETKGTGLINEIWNERLEELKGDKMVVKTPSELIKQTIELAEEVKKMAGTSEAEGWIPYYQFVNKNIQGLPDVGKISDGYHTFDELYNHRCYLWLALCKLLYASYGEYHGYQVWRTDTHSDGERWKRWFILGVGTEAGEQMTYHLPSEMWSECGLIEIIEKAPEFDDHSSEEVLVRLGKVIKKLTGI